jgi:hypothetical protein
MNYNKILLSAILVVMFACNASDQNSASNNEVQNETKSNDKANVDVPAAVKSDFEQKYPAANDVEWEKDGNEYKVDFRINGEKNTLKYGEDNSVKKSEIRIDKSALPAAVTKTVESQYSGYTIEKADEINEVGKGKQYEVEVKKGDEVLDVHLTPNGEIIKKDPEKKKKDKN